jgi:DNA ligase (NAD+)
VPESRKKELSRVLAELDTLYELGETCIHPDTKKIVSDPEYDDLLAELKQVDPKHLRFTRPSDSKATSSAEKIKNDPPLTSISKASHEDLKIQTDQFDKWKDTTNGEDLYLEFKLDGVCLRLYYEDGVLMKASTRPRDGVWGDDVTEQAKHVSNIPHKLKEPVTCSITGELLCLFSDFETVQKQLLAAGEKLRANPRNHTAGAIRNFKEPEKVKDMRLTFIGYSVENLENPPYTNEIDRAKWVNKDLGVRYVRSTPFKSNKQLKEMEDLVKNLGYAVDGVIVGVNDIEAQEQMGRHGDSDTGNPKGKIAWKFRSEKASVKVNYIEYATGRTGKITPVACFDGVPLAGTTVTRATLHNYGFVIEHKIKVGTTIEITKAGEIIPKVIGVKAGAGKPDIPERCPSCGGTTKLRTSTNNSEKSALWCTFTDRCPAQQIGRLHHYLDKFGVLGLGESTVTKLVENGKVKHFADFYKLTVEDVERCGLSERQSSLAVASIHMIRSPEKTKDTDKLKAKIAQVIKKKKKVSLAKLIGSFGISGIGETTGRALVEHFKNFDKIRCASVAQLEEVDAVGGITAESLCAFLKAWDYQIDALLDHVMPELPKVGKFTGTTFVLSGKVNKKTIKAQIEKLGGSGTKSDKAEELGVKIITADEFEKMV